MGRGTKIITEGKLLFIIPNVQINSLNVYSSWCMPSNHFCQGTVCFHNRNVAYSKAYSIVPINVHGSTSYELLRQQIFIECL